MNLYKNKQKNIHDTYLKCMNKEDFDNYKLLNNSVFALVIV